jgi:hypothetical protein
MDIPDSIIQALKDFILDMKRSIVLEKEGFGHKLADNSRRTIWKKGFNAPMIETGTMYDELQVEITTEDDAIVIEAISPVKYSSYAQRTKNGWNFIDFTPDEMKAICNRFEELINE